MAIPDEQTEVIICGGGPTGALLSALLGQMHVPNIVLEKEADITTDPRGIALDEDGIRILQSIGVYDRVYTEIGSCMKKFKFLSGTGKDLRKQPLLEIDYNTSEGGTGHVGFICHKQPVLEKAVRDQVSASPFSQLWSGCKVTAVSEDADQVYVEYMDPEQKIRKLRGRFLVGADGKTGFVRKKYLEPKGIVLERCIGTNYEETWVALNWQISLPTEKTHPQFALWKLGYTPKEVYDLFFPENFRFLCNPKRPAVCGRFGLPADRLWRFEFVVQKGEDPTHMASDQEIKKIIYPYITHSGDRYGLPHPVRFPDDCIKILRSRPFFFSARNCNKWSLGRVTLAGDAAHVFPPFGGQGIASGFRDASALAWRLGLLHRHPQADYSKLFTAWYTERKQQFERSLAATVHNGAYVTEADPIKVFWREWYLWAVQLVPSWKREIEKGPRAQGMTRYQYSHGLPFLPDLDGGVLLPQVYARNLKNDAVVFTDDLIFAPSKNGLFQLLILLNTVDELEDSVANIDDVDRLSSGLVLAAESTILVQDVQAKQLKENNAVASMARIATADEFAADPILCGNRPRPQYYDPLRLQKEVKGKRFVIVRPDRFIFAVCADRAELRDALGRLPLAVQI